MLIVDRGTDERTNRPELLCHTLLEAGVTKIFQEYFQCLTVRIQIKPDFFVWPNLGPKFLQRLSGDKRKE